MRHHEAAAYAMACALVVFRSAVFVFHEHAHFDSDQAIVGLMALDLSRFDAFPLFFYGQKYMLGVESWIAAPFVAALGPTVFALKLPLLLINCGIAIALVRMLSREAGLPPFSALAAAAFFVIAPPVAASRLVEAQGANIEPFAYVLLLWVLRRRPWIFGAVLGVAWVHREFTIYAAIALAVMALAERRLFAKPTLAAAGRAAIALVAVVAAVTFLTRFATNFVAAGYRPRPPFGGLDAALDRLAAAKQSLAILVGAEPHPLAVFNIQSTLTTGRGWIAAVLIVMLAAALLANARMTRFAKFLLLVGVQAALVHAIFATGDAMQMRYGLLALLVPIALLATAARGAFTAATGVAAACLAVWIAASLVDHGRLIAEYATRRPPNEHRELAMYLEGNGLRSGHAPYWTAYHVTYLTGRRVVLSSPEFVRIPAFERVVNEDPSAVEIRLEPCPGAHIRRWYICR